MQLAIAWQQTLLALVAVGIATLTLAARPAEHHGLLTEQDQVSQLDESLASAGLPEVLENSGPLISGNLQLTFFPDNQRANSALFEIEDTYGNVFMSPVAQFAQSASGTLSASMSFNKEYSSKFLKITRRNNLDQVSQCDVTVNLAVIGDTTLATKVTLGLWKHGAAARATGATLGTITNGVGGLLVGVHDAVIYHPKAQPKRGPLVDTDPETGSIEFSISKEKLQAAERRAAQLEQRAAQLEQLQPAAPARSKAQESLPATRCDTVPSPCVEGSLVMGMLSGRRFKGKVLMVFPDGRIAVNEMMAIEGEPLKVGSLALEARQLAPI